MLENTSIEFEFLGVEKIDNFGNEWEHRKWEVTLYYKDNHMTVPYMTGMGIPELELDDVIDSLIMDSSVEGYEFKEWAIDMGYNSDSRMAEKVYNQCVEQTKKFKELLGEDFNDFISNFIDNQ